MSASLGLRVKGLGTSTSCQLLPPRPQSRLDEILVVSHSSVSYQLRPFLSVISIFESLIEQNVWR
jgi:hypothetical protein